MMALLNSFCMHLLRLRLRFACFADVLAWLGQSFHSLHASLGHSLHSSTRATPSRTLCTCRRRSWARRHCGSAAGTSMPGRYGTSRWGIVLFSVSIVRIHTAILILSLHHQSPSSSAVTQAQSPQYNSVRGSKRTLRLIDIIPRALAAQDVFDFLLLQILALVVALIDHELIWASQALEAVLADVGLGSWIAGCDARDAQHVAACGAEE